MLIAYMDLILADAGANVLVGSLGYAIAQVLAAVFVGLYLAERVGRRVLLRASAVRGLTMPTQVLRTSGSLRPPSHGTIRIGAEAMQRRAGDAELQRGAAQLGTCASASHASFELCREQYV